MMQSQTYPEVETRSLAAPDAPATATESVFEKLLADIVSGSYPAGSRLPAERDLSKQLGASRPTLREALRRLSEWNLVAARRGSGIVVRPRAEWMMEALPSYLRYANPGPSGPTKGVVVVDLLKLRRTMMIEILRMVGGRVSPGSTTEARECLAEAWDRRADGAEFARADLSVLRAVVSAANFLPGIWMINRLSGIYCDLARSLGSAVAPPENYREAYCQVLDAVEAGDVDRAADLLSAYLEEHDQNLVKLLEFWS